MDSCLDLIGRPFAPGGRGPADFDCYGIVRHVLGRNGSAIPDYPSVESVEVNAALILAAMEAGWEKLEGPAPGTVVLFRMDLAVGTHVGVMVDGLRFLHVLKETGVVIEKISGHVWRNRVIGHYRWKG